MANKIQSFETVQEFIDYLRTAPCDISWQGNSSYGSPYRSSHDNNRGDWNGTRTIKDAYRMAEHGWPEGLAKLTDKMGLGLSTGRSRYRVYDVAGDFPSVGRAIAGMPDSMTRRVIASGTRKPVVELVFNGSFASSCDPDSIMNYGAAIATAIDELEDAGFSVGLQITATTNIGERSDPKIIAPIINLKKPGEPMELDRLVFFTANPAFLRRLVFAHWETMATKSQLGSAYGYICDLPDVPEETIYFGKQGANFNDNCRTPESARAYVKSIIKAKRPDLFANDDSEAA